MISKMVTYDELEHLLIQVGFVVSRAADGHKVYKHQASDTLIVLPSNGDNDSVSLTHLVAVRRTIAEKGLLDGESFDRLLGHA